jgi:hypothetical protein
VADGFSIGPVQDSEREGGMLCTNHSCAPNIGVQGQIVFVAMRDIAAGEELTHDWATTDDNDDVMTCRCDAAGCRGTVTGKDWQRVNLQRKYAGYFSWYLERKIPGQASSTLRDRDGRDKLQQRHRHKNDGSLRRVAVRRLQCEQARNADSGGHSQHCTRISSASLTHAERNTNRLADGGSPYRSVQIANPLLVRAGPALTQTGPDDTACE